MYRTALATAFMLWTVTQALAHALLQSASPAVGSTVRAAPAQVEITFSEGVEPRFSAIEVRDGAGQRVDKGDAHTAPRDDRHLAVSLGPIPPGTYKVAWHATSVDTHKTEGSFTFTVAPQGAR
jgi:copper resistance protein C